MTNTLSSVTTQPRPRGCRARGAIAAGAIAAATFSCVALGAGPAAAATTVPVTQADLLPCADTPSPTGFCQDSGGGGSIAVVADKGAVLGSSSLQLATQPDAAYTEVAKQFPADTSLASINDLGYQTYLNEFATSNVQVTSLVLGLDPQGDGGATKYVIWEPAYTSTPVKTGAWQSWNPSTTPTGKGGFWTPGDAATDSLNSLGFKQYTASFADVKSALPKAKVREIGLNQGTGNPGLTTLVDGLRVNGTTYDFEAAAPATGSADLSSAISVAPFSTGSNTDVKVVVTNNGPNPSGATSVTALALGYQVGKAGAGTLNDNGTVTFAVPKLAPGASSTVSFSLSTPPGFRAGLVGDFVSPAAGQPDPNLFNNIAIAGLASNGTAAVPQ